MSSVICSNFAHFKTLYVYIIISLPSVLQSFNLAFRAPKSSGNSPVQHHVVRQVGVGGVEQFGDEEHPRLRRPAPQIAGGELVGDLACGADRRRQTRQPEEERPMEDHH